METTCRDIHKHLLEHEIIGVGEQETITSNGATFIFARNGRAKNIYLPLGDGQSSMINGILLPKNATVLSVVADSEGTQDWTLEIRKNGATMSLFSLAAIGGSAYTSAANVDVDQGDRIQMFCNTSNFWGIQHPVVWIEIAWRI